MLLILRANNVAHTWKIYNPSVKPTTQHILICKCFIFHVYEHYCLWSFRMLFSFWLGYIFFFLKACLFRPSHAHAVSITDSSNSNKNPRLFFFFCLLIFTWTYLFYEGRQPFKKYPNTFWCYYLLYSFLWWC